MGVSFLGLGCGRGSLFGGSLANNIWLCSVCSAYPLYFISHFVRSAIWHVCHISTPLQPFSNCTHLPPLTPYDAFSSPSGVRLRLRMRGCY